MKLIAPVVLSALAVLASSAVADNTLARFKGGIGVIPVSSGVVTPATAATALTAEAVNRNFVRGVPPPGQIWRIRDLDATVKTDGSIRVRGRGLLLAGGNGLGSNAGAKVFATLICEGAAPFTEHSTTAAGVPLAPNGDFEIDDLLSPAPPAPTACASPVLLIRNAGNLAWFAAGIPDLD
jgi:hypothetical protein